jgi:DNA-binding response OmpR family regulator
MGPSNHILAVVQSDLQLICSLRGFLEVNGYSSLTIARNSQEAILYFRGVGIYADRFRFPLPALLILDSSNPDGSDLDVLGWVREHSGFESLPVLILCAEKHSSVHVTCLLDPASFIVDRGNFGDLLDALRTADAGELQPTLT